MVVLINIMFSVAKEASDIIVRTVFIFIFILFYFIHIHKALLNILNSDNLGYRR